MTDIALGVVLGLAFATFIGRLVRWAWDNRVAGQLLGLAPLTAPIPLWWRLLAVLITGEDPLHGSRWIRRDGR